MFSLVTWQICLLSPYVAELLSALTFLVGVLIGGASVQWIGLRKNDIYRSPVFPIV